MGWAQCAVRALTTLCDYRTCVQRNAVVQGEQVEGPVDHARFTPGPVQGRQSA